jgi:hypothetical protein
MHLSPYSVQHSKYNTTYNVQQCKQALCTTQLVVVHVQRRDRLQRLHWRVEYCKRGNHAGMRMRTATVAWSSLPLRVPAAAPLLFHCGSQRCAVRIGWITAQTWARTCTPLRPSSAECWVREAVHLARVHACRLGLHPRVARGASTRQDLHDRGRDAADCVRSCSHARRP